MSLISVHAEYHLRCDFCPDGARPHTRTVGATVAGNKFLKDGWDAVEPGLDEEAIKRLKGSGWHIIGPEKVDGKARDMCGDCARTTYDIWHGNGKVHPDAGVDQWLRSVKPRGKFGDLLGEGEGGDE